MDQVLAVAVVAAVLTGALVLFRPRPTLVISIRRGKPFVARGNAPAKLLGDLEQLCAECDIDTARISAYSSRGRSTLRFSSRIPAEHHQRFRNVYNLYR